MFKLLTRLGSICFVGLLTSTLASTGLASESRFIVNQIEGTSDILLEYKNLDGRFENEGILSGGTVVTNQVRAEYQRAVAEKTRFTISTSFAQKRVSFDAADTIPMSTKGSGISFGDLELTLKSAEVEPEFTWYYGGLASISPSAARDPRFSRQAGGNGRVDANNFSGYQTLGGMIGMETYADNLALGAQFEARIFSDRNVADGSSSQSEVLSERVIPTLSGFLEFPILKTVSVGFDAAVTRPDFQLDKILIGGNNNRYRGKLFSEWRIDKETAAVLDFGQSSKIFPYVENESSMNIGVRKSL